MQNNLTSIETVSFYGLHKGPRLIVTGSVHGNEPAGPLAITRLIEEFRTGKRQLLRGQVTFVPVVNALARHHNTRIGDRNLNRNLAESAIPQDNEDHVANVLCPLFRAHDVLIDLHSFNSAGQAFALIGPPDNNGTLEPFSHAKEEEALVKSFGLPMVVYGWLPAHEKALHMKRKAGVRQDLASLHGVGTTEYMRFSGGYAITVECGQHLDPQGPQIGYDCVINGMMTLGMIEKSGEYVASPRVLQICDPILSEHPDDRLVKHFTAGEAVKSGEIIGTRANGSDIVMPYDGAIIFASVSADLHEELCFLCKESDRLQD
ncbi:succinylglutamate desuccinylase/aspartoacylase family protein [Brucellaceae bacterium C25G]